MYVVSFFRPPPTAGSFVLMYMHFIMDMFGCWVSGVWWCLISISLFYNDVRSCAQCGAVNSRDNSTLATNALGDPAPYRPGNDVRILWRHL